MIFFGSGGLLASLLISVVLTVALNFILFLMGYDTFLFRR